MIAVQACDSPYVADCCWLVRLFRQEKSVAENGCAFFNGWNWPVEAGFVYTVRAFGDLNYRFQMVFTHPN